MHQFWQIELSPESTKHGALRFGRRNEQNANGMSYAHNRTDTAESYSAIIHCTHMFRNTLANHIFSNGKIMSSKINTVSMGCHE